MTAFSKRTVGRGAGRGTHRGCSVCGLIRTTSRSSALPFGKGGHQDIDVDMQEPTADTDPNSVNIKELRFHIDHLSSLGNPIENAKATISIRGLDPEALCAQIKAFWHQMTSLKLVSTCINILTNVVNKNCTR